MTSLCPNPTWSLTARPMRCYRPQEERIVFQPFFKGKLAVKLRSPGCRIWSSWWIISTSHPEWESPHPQKHLQIEWRSFWGVKQMYTFLSPASWILSFKIPQFGPTFRNMTHMDFKTLSFPPKDGFFSIQFFLVKKRFDARKSKQLCWIWWGWLESQVGHPLSKPTDHEFIGTLGNSQGGPGHLEAQPPRWCFSSQRGGSRGEAKLMWQNRLHTLIRCFFLDVLSCWGEKVLKAERCWKFHSFGVAKFPFAQIYSWTCSENPLRICGTALLGTCRFAKPLLYSCGNAPAKNGLFSCWLRWVFSCRDGSGETFFITFCWLIVVQGGFLLIPLILAIWKPVFWSFTLQWFSPGLTFLVCQDHCHRWRDTRPVFMSKSAGFWTQLFSAHGKEKIRKCVFLFCATSITGQLETQQDEMWWDFLGCSEF